MQETTFLSNMKNVRQSAKSLPEQVAEQISDLIIEQHMEVGEKIPNEFELAQRLNVGRGTVREAIKLLVARNVLEIQRGKGTFVANNTGLVDDPFGFAYIEDQEALVCDLYQVRIRLEPWIAELAAKNATEEDIARLRHYQHEVEALIHTGQNHLPMDQKLHSCIAQSTHSCVLPAIGSTIIYSVHLFGAMNNRTQTRQTIETHAQIVDAIAAHDPDAAREATLQHLKLNWASVPALQKAFPDGLYIS